MIQSNITRAANGSNDFIKAKCAAPANWARSHGEVPRGNRWFIKNVLKLKSLNDKRLVNSKITMPWAKTGQSMPVKRHRLDIEAGLVKISYVKI